METYNFFSNHFKGILPASVIQGAAMKRLRFPGGTSGKEPACQCKRCKRLGFDPWTGRVCSEGGHGNPLQCSCLGNPMDRGAWQGTVRGVAKSQTQLSMYTHTHTHTHKHCHLKAAQSPLLIWRINNSFSAQLWSILIYLIIIFKDKACTK